MKNFFESISLQQLKDKTQEEILLKVLPHFLLEIVSKYFRMKIEGFENLPKNGAALICPNHSGFSGLDAVLLGHEIQKYTQRIPIVLAHHLWFLTKSISIPANKLGFFEATTQNAKDQLKNGNLTILFPEGESGNFKKSSQRYRLQEFKRGFVRIALSAQTPIIPVLIVGAEEANINLTQLKFTKSLIGTVLPLPLNVLPFPSKWKIKVLKPIFLPYKPESANDSDLVHEICQDIHEKMQKELSKEAGNRRTVFI